MAVYSPQNSSRPVRFGVVGAGDSFIRYFYPEFMELENAGEAKIVAVSDIISEEEFVGKLSVVENDPDEGQGKKAAAARIKNKIESREMIYFRTDEKALPDYYRNGNMDALYIATPNDTHKNYTIQGIERGLNILCEKPLASRKTDTMKMTEESERHPELVCMEASHYNYKPTVLKLYGVIGKLVKEHGPITHIDGRVVETFDYDAKIIDGGILYRKRLADNILNRDRGGGTVIDTGGHLLAILLMLDPSLVLRDADLYNFDKDVFSAETAMVADIRANGDLFGPDASVYLKAAKFYHRKEKFFDITLGEKNNRAGKIHINFDDNEIAYTQNNRYEELQLVGSAHKNLLDRFVEAVRNKDDDLIMTGFNKAIKKIGFVEDIYAFSEGKNNGSVWRRDKYEFYRPIPGLAASGGVSWHEAPVHA
jgi:predicted dehydrogenase